MSVMNVATPKTKKSFYCIKGEWKLLTKEQFQKEFIKAYPLRASITLNMGKLFVLVLKTALVFLFVTAIYAVFKWAIGVWI